MPSCRARRRGRRRCAGPGRRGWPRRDERSAPDRRRAGPGRASLVAVAMSGGLDSSVVGLAARRARRGGGRPLDAALGPLRGARPWPVLRRARPRRRPAGGRPGRHSALHTAAWTRSSASTSSIRSSRDYLGGPDAVALRALQHLRQVRPPARTRRAAGRRAVATGHYARILEGPEGPELHTAVDPDKDQSYYLFELTARAARRRSFPLGGMTKTEVREIARRAGLVGRREGRGMEVCFVDWRRARVRRGARSRRGPDGSAAPRSVPAGRARRPRQATSSAKGSLTTATPWASAGVWASRPATRRYVLEVLPAENAVVVGDEADLEAPGLAGERLHWIGAAACSAGGGDGEDPIAPSRRRGA